MKKREKHIHCWRPLAIDENTGFIFYICVKCEQVVYFEINYIDHISEHN